MGYREKRKIGERLGLFSMHGVEKLPDDRYGLHVKYSVRPHSA